MQAGARMGSGSTGRRAVLPSSRAHDVARPHACTRSHAQAGSLAPLDKALACMDEGKRKKLEEAVQQAARGGGAGAAAARGGAAAAAPAASSRAASKAASPATSPRSSATGNGGRPAAPGRAPPSRSASAASRPATAAAAKPRAAPAAAAAAASAAAPAAGGGAAEDEGALSSGVWGAGEAKDRLAELLGEQLVGELGDPQWKVRLEAMDAVVARAQGPGAEEHAVLLVQAMAHLPGWDEKNFQVMARQFDVIRAAAGHAGFGRSEALVAVTGAVDK